MDTDNGTRWLTEDEQRAWRIHLDVSRLLSYQMERDLQPFGLTLNDYEILVNLSESADRRLRMSDLASATLQSKSRLSHQITRMEKAELVRRESCESDKRGLFAVLTEHGWQTLREVAPTMWPRSAATSSTGWTRAICPTWSRPCGRSPRSSGQSGGGSDL